MAAAPPIPAAATSGPRRWLFGPIPDLFLGCGLAYFAVFLLLCVAGDAVRSIQPVALIPFLLVVLTGVPHYGATLVRVYERPEDRRAYVFFTVHVTIAVWLAFALGLHWIGFGSLWLSLYLTWSPWHYTGQNYGLAVMFLRRRGVALDDTTKRLLYASFVLSFLLTFLTMHGNGPTSTYAPVSYAGTVFRFVSLGIPHAIAQPALAAAAVAYGGTLALVFGRLLRGASPRDLVPVALLVASQALWFAVPVMVREWNVPGVSGLAPFAVEQAGYTFLWIAAAHSVQYLWVTTYYAGMSGLPRGKAHYLGKTLLAGAAIWTVPTLVFGPSLLGRVPYDAGLALLGAATVNLHHFLLDGAIWKLRDGRVARVLLRSAGSGAAPEAAAPTPRRRWIAPAIWASGLLSLAIIVGNWWLVHVELSRATAQGDLAQAERIVGWLGVIDRDAPDMHVKLGQLRAQRRDLRGAREAYLRSLSLGPSADAHMGIAAIHEHEGRWLDAIAEYDSVLALNPMHVPALYRSGLAWMKQGDPARAKMQLERAAELAPDDKLVRLSLERAANAGG